MHLPPYKSESKQITAMPGGTPLEFPAWVPEQGPGGGRLVIDRFIVVATGTITVAAAVWDGRDVPRFYQQIVVEQIDGKQRWNLTGHKSRPMSIHLNGIDAHQEHGNVAIGAAQAVDSRLIIPMAKLKSAYEDADYAMPADMLRKVTLVINSLAGAQTGATVLSVPSFTIYVLAECHEEDTVQYKAEDIVKSVDFNSTTQAQLACVGVVHDMLVLKEDTTAGGGASINAITDARIESLGLPTLTRQDLVHWYRQKRKTTASGPTTPATERYLDPIQEGKALPILAADDQTSVWHGRIVNNMKVDVGTGLAGLALVTREVTEKSQAGVNAQSALWRVDAKSIRMKVGSVSKRALSAWGDRAQLVGVWEAESPRLAAAAP